MSKHFLASAPTAFALGLAIAASASAAPPSATQLLIPDGVDTSRTAQTQLATRNGPQRVTVSLASKPLALIAGNKRSGSLWSRNRQRNYLARLRAEQDAAMAAIAALGGVELARVSKAHNALVVSIDAKKIPDLAKVSGVTGVRRLIDYRMDLDETVPYIGAAAAQAAGVDGSGVSVAVLDSGIDYTHRNLGGPGTVAFYDDCYAGNGAAPVGDCADYFGPGAPKVVGGFDFVGEEWPSAGRSEDPNPIDFEGHGTHVADIIGGRSADGTHKGVAPGVDLYAVKVCSAIASSCNGVALLLGMDFALDPNGDGDIADAVDVINMSLGSSYGQREDDLSLASANASKFGVTVVASAGNSADRPFITGSPSVTPEVISVAQTNVPSAITYPLTISAPAGIAGVYSNTNTVDWAPILGGFNGNVKTALPAGSLTGFVALIDRGACSISFKTHNAAVAGAIGVLVANNAGGDAPSFSYGGTPGDVPFVPAQTLILTQSTGNVIKSQLAAGAAVVAGVSPAVTTPLVGSIVASSSRGPGYSYAVIKPDIGAPGASVSAIAGSGDGTEAFGGTSGAAPMVAGSAALILQKFPMLQPHEVKARLMHAADTNVFTNPATQPGVLAPITRIGAGEVRVDDALEVTTGAWDAANPAAVGLSFGTHRNIGVTTYRKKVAVRNYSNTARNYTIGTNFRFANDAASGAVTVTTPASVAVPALGTATFTMSLRVDASRLPAWNLNGGSAGGNGAALNLPEYDGYLTLSNDGETVHLPWHILPHKAANVVASTTALALGGADSGEVMLSNLGGAVSGGFDVFSLNETSPQIPPVFQPRPGDNYAIIDLKSVGSRLVDAGSGGLAVQFGIETWGQRSHPNYPAEFDVFIDTNGDDEFDFVVYTIELTGFAATGQNVTAVQNLSNGTTSIRFFTDADLSSSNVIMTAALSDMGLTADSQFSYVVAAFDNYFTGNLTDLVGPSTVTLSKPRFSSGSGGSVPIGLAGPLAISYDAGNDAASPSDIGRLLLYRNARTGAEASAIAVTP
jgi:minor extracellular serine protease Vpr